MSYPGYPPNNQGYPGQPGAPQPQTSNPTGYPPTSGYPPNSGYPPTSGYPQTSPYPSQPGYAPQPSAYSSQPFGQYPPQQPGQYAPNQPYPSAYPPAASQYPSSTPAPSQYPSATPTPGYPPQPSGYPSTLPGPTTAPGYPPQPAGYPPQAGYSSSQQVPSPYPNMTAGGYGAGHQVPPQAQYPPMTTPAHYQPVGSSQVPNKANPTVRPAHPFDARQDAEILRKAMKGFGTDEKAIINVLAHRVNAQRQEIAVHFKTMYGKDLISELKSELADKFEDLIVALMTPTYDYLANELHYAMDGVGTNEETVIEIICTANNSEIHNIKLAYHKLFGSDLEKDLHGETSGSFRRLLVSLCQGRRSESTAVDVASAQIDAQNLLKAGELQLGTDESTFNMVLCSRSYTQLQQVFLEYHRMAGRDFEDVIKSEFSGDIKSGLRAIVKSVRNKSAYFAERLHESLAGMGTKDRVLIRIVATRCEIDMVDIKNAYLSLYGKSLEADIAGDTSGDYKKCLTALVVG